MPRTEREVLTDQLAGQRAHVLGAIEGLDDDALRRPVLPSGWSCLGLIWHLAIDVERFWFGAVVAGDDAIIAEVTSPHDDAWVAGATMAPGDVLDGYRKQIEVADAVIGATSFEAAPVWWPDFFGEWRLDSHREVLAHVLTETATHAGHLDAACELIDGRTWLRLT